MAARGDRGGLGRDLDTGRAHHTSSNTSPQPFSRMPRRSATATQLTLWSRGFWASAGCLCGCGHDRDHGSGSSLPDAERAGPRRTDVRRRLAVLLGLVLLVVVGPLVGVPTPHNRHRATASPRASPSTVRSISGRTATASAWPRVVSSVISGPTSRRVSRYPQAGVSRRPCSGSRTSHARSRNGGKAIHSVVGHVVVGHAAVRHPGLRCCFSLAGDVSRAATSRWRLRGSSSASRR